MSTPPPTHSPNSTHSDQDDDDKMDTISLPSTIEPRSSSLERRDSRPEEVPASPWFVRGLFLNGSHDLDGALEILLTLTGVSLSISIGLGFFGTGRWSRDVVIAIYSLTADQCVGTSLSSLFGIASALAQRGRAVNYDTLTILGSLEPRTPYRFSELSLKKFLIFTIIIALTFGPDQYVNFMLPQDRSVRSNHPDERVIRQGPIGGAYYERDENGDKIYRYNTTGLRFVSQTGKLQEQERKRVSKQISDSSNEYFLPLKPTILYDGSATAGSMGDFVTDVVVQKNIGIYMNMTTGSNVCVMDARTAGESYREGESFGAILKTAAQRTDEFSVTLCVEYNDSEGNVFAADFRLSNHSAAVTYQSNGVTNWIESIDALSEPHQLLEIDQIDKGTHNMTDCFLNMLVFVNPINQAKELSDVGIGFIIRGANSTNSYGFSDGDGLPADAIVATGNLVFGGTGAVFQAILALAGIRILLTIVTWFLEPAMTGETRQSISVFADVSKTLPDCLSTAANRKLARDQGIPNVIIGIEKGSQPSLDDNVMNIPTLICGYYLKSSLLKGQRTIHLTAGSVEDIVPWEKLRYHEDIQTGTVQVRGCRGRRIRTHKIL